MKVFPVLQSADPRQGPRLLKGIPWELVERHEDQAEKNHGQALRELASRGGLGPAELLAVLEDRKYEAVPSIDAELAIMVYASIYMPARKTNV